VVKDSLPQEPPSALDPPKPNAMDRLNSAGKVGTAVGVTLAHFPLAPVVMEFWNLVVPSGFNRRTREWQEWVSKTIKELVDRFGKLPEELARDDKFLDAVALAGIAAMKDHRREKWDLLRNALMNAASPSSFDDDVQQLLLRLVDEIGLTHIAILKAILNPQVEPKTGEPKIHSASVYGQPILEFLKERLGKTSADEPDLRLLLDQLATQGLLPENNTLPTWRGALQLYKDLTPMGKRFLAFVSSPSPP
jgi:hypothetical protein